MSVLVTPVPAPGSAEDCPGPVARLALAMTAWTERWVPDAFVFALLATVLVVVAALVSTPAGLGEIAEIWGNGFWELCRSPCRCRW